MRRLEQENDDEYTHQRSKSEISNLQFLSEGNGYNMTQITRNDLEVLQNKNHSLRMEIEDVKIRAKRAEEEVITL